MTVTIPAVVVTVGHYAWIAGKVALVLLAIFGLYMLFWLRDFKVWPG